MISPSRPNRSETRVTKCEKPKMDSGPQETRTRRTKNKNKSKNKNKRKIWQTLANYILSKDSKLRDHQIYQALAFTRWKQGRHREALAHFHDMEGSLGKTAALCENIGHTYNATLGTEAAAFVVKL